MQRGASILVVLGQTLDRAVLVAWLRTHGFVVVGDSENADDAAAEAIRCSPDVVLIGLAPGAIAALEASRSIHSRLPDVRILGLISEICDRMIEEGLRSGLCGFFSTLEPPEQLAVAIQALLNGQNYFSPQIRDRMLPSATGARTRASTLTPRELEILCLLARGLSKRQIGENICLSIKTVDNHCTSIMAKLNIHNRVDLARYAIREGFTKA